MTTQQYLTTSQKERMLPVLITRDGPNCFYCNLPFEPMVNDLKRTFDHLDNNRLHNALENLVLAHWKCNQMKKTYFEYQVKAKEKINENSDSLYECVKITATPKEASKEIDINVAQKKLTWEYLNERLVGDKVHQAPEKALELNDTANSISFIFWERTGHGSSETVKRYIKDFCSSAAPFKLVEIDGNWLIQRRTGN